MKKLMSFCLAGVLLAFGATAAYAQDYPARPVRIIVPYPAGGAPDLLARMVGQHLSTVLGQQFIAENRTGASGILATELVAKAPPDGYTLLLSDTGPLAINPNLFSKLPYSSPKDFALVSLALSIPLYVVAQPSLQINTLPELVALARAKPGQLAYGSSGIGSIHHITMESLKAGLGLDIVHVPYKGVGQSVPAFQAGDIPLLVSALTGASPLVKAGKGKLLAVTSLRRDPLSPDVAPVSDLIPGFDFSSEMGFAAPAGTPPAIVSRLSSEIATALKQPEVIKRFTAMGGILIGSSPQAYTENIQRNLQAFAKAVKDSGAKVD